MPELLAVASGRPLTWICTYGNFGLRTNGDPNSYGQSVVLDVSLTDRFNYVFQTDYTNADRANLMGEDLGINQYLFYTVGDAFALGARVEWWRDDQVSHAEATFGANIFALQNLRFRPEYRKDWLGGFDTDIFGMDMILTY